MPNELSYEVSLERSNQIRADLPQHPEKYTMLTGDRPTGRLHLGHYFGTLKSRVELQDMGVHTNVLIADYQVITDRDSTEHIQDNVYNMVIDYLACGLDPDKTMIYTHSAVPAANQLMLPFLPLVSEALLQRNPTVKAEMEASGHELTGLLLTYPVHQDKTVQCPTGWPRAQVWRENGHLNSRSAHIHPVRKCASSASMSTAAWKRSRRAIPAPSAATRSPLSPRPWCTGPRPWSP